MNINSSARVAITCLFTGFLFFSGRSSLRSAGNAGGGQQAVITARKPLVDNKMPRQVIFRLATYNSELENFRDTVDMALHLLSRVFSSREFRDSLAKYSFPCSNGKSKPCLNCPQLQASKCDSAFNIIHGTTVYKDLTVDSVIDLSITIKNPEKKTRTIGFSYGCKYQITTYAWWLKSRKDVIENYAIHLGHEYAHVVGYVHSKSHTKKEDVSYKIGGLVRNIIRKWEQSPS